MIVSTVRQSDIKEVQALPSDTEDLVNLTLAVKGTELAVILIEQPDGRIKTSFRSRCHVDCNALAAPVRRRRPQGGGRRDPRRARSTPAREQVLAAVDEAWRPQARRSQHGNRR